MIVPRSSKVYDVQFKLDSGRLVERIEIFEIRRVSKSRNEGSKNDRKRGDSFYSLAAKPELIDTFLLFLFSPDWLALFAPFGFFSTRREWRGDYFFGSEIEETEIGRNRRGKDIFILFDLVFLRERRGMKAICTECDRRTKVWNLWMETIVRIIAFCVSRGRVCCFYALFPRDERSFHGNPIRVFASKFPSTRPLLIKGR